MADRAKLGNGCATRTLSRCFGAPVVVARAESRFRRDSSGVARAMWRGVGSGMAGRACGATVAETRHVWRFVKARRPVAAGPEAVSCGAEPDSSGEARDLVESCAWQDASGSRGRSAGEARVGVRKVARVGA